MRKRKSSPWSKYFRDNESHTAVRRELGGDSGDQTVGERDTDHWGFLIEHETKMMAPIKSFYFWVTFLQLRRMPGSEIVDDPDHGASLIRPSSRDASTRWGGDEQEPEGWQKRGSRIDDRELIWYGNGRRRGSWGERRWASSRSGPPAGNGRSLRPEIPTSSSAAVRCAPPVAGGSFALLRRIRRARGTCAGSPPNQTMAEIDRREWL